MSNDRGACRHCVRPIHRIAAPGAHQSEWVHSEPLGDLRVSQAEFSSIMADPPRAHDSLHRPPVLHRPEPDLILGTF